MLWRVRLRLRSVLAHDDSTNRMALLLHKLPSLLDDLRRRSLDLMFPPTCLACDADLADESWETDGGFFCTFCRGQIELLQEPICEVCASPVPVAASVRLDCGVCRKLKPRFDRTVALGPYEGLLRDLILGMKSEPRQLVTRSLLDYAWKLQSDALRELHVDAICAVPTHFLREWKRGANAPHALATSLARRLEVPFVKSLLSRKSNTPPQAGLSRPARLLNIRGEILVRKNRAASLGHVLLVDDVLTTGSTANECARVLKRSGIAKVSVFVLGRTPDLG